MSEKTAFLTRKVQPNPANKSATMHADPAKVSRQDVPYKAGSLGSGKDPGPKWIKRK